TNGARNVTVKATYGTGGHISSADFTLTVRATYGGCSTGFASLSLLAMALLPFAAKKRKK
ncbi:MAG: Synerg-CTERM sorting domain-containing protein, partial [Synergistaceae bacterium]